MDRKQLIIILDELFKENNFKKRGTIRWELSNESIIKMIMLQKSYYGNYYYYYLNYGYILKNLELDRTEMHIFNCFGSSHKNENNRIKQLLDLETDIDDETRKKELINFIKIYILKEFNNIEDENDILEELKKRKRNNITFNVLKYFNLPVD